MMNRLNRKKILITGASQGLGRQLALDFAREGAAALALCARHSQPVDKVRHEVTVVAPDIKVVLIEADLSRPLDIERLFAIALHEFHGRLDVLVNNASMLGPSPMPYLLDYPLEEFQAVLNANLIGPFLAIRNAFPAMIEHGGSLLNAPSDSATVGYAGG